jgi:hypothetical protein
MLLPVSLAAKANWPASVSNSMEGFYRFDSEPVVADLDANGNAEIIFVSLVQKQSSGSMQLGKLHVLDHKGNSLHEINLPVKIGMVPLLHPTFANIDGYSDLEIVVNTVALPMTSQVPWKQEFCGKHEGTNNSKNTLEPYPSRGH